MEALRDEHGVGPVCHERDIARQGIQVPVEGHPDRYITDSAAAEVPDTAYWQRRLKDGDLLLYKPDAPDEAETVAETEAVAAAVPDETQTEKSSKLASTDVKGENDRYDRTVPDL